jgi:hypothetical protein
MSASPSISTFLHLLSIHQLLLEIYSQANFIRPQVLSMAFKRGIFPLYANIHHGLIPRQYGLRRCPQPIASFSTHFAVANKQIGSQKGQSQGNHPHNPEIPSFSLDSLGLSKTTKTVVLVILGVFGTIESWFWVQTIWRWWKSDDEGTN